MPMINQSPKYCVLIDDDEDDLFVFGDTIHKNFEQISFIGYQNVEGFFKVLDEIDCSKIAYIFLDLNMPKVNGMEALDRLKKCDAVKNIPVIIYSTSNNPTDVNMALKKGARAFISKPSKISDLVDELSVYFEPIKV